MGDKPKRGQKGPKKPKSKGKKGANMGGKELPKR